MPPKALIVQDQDLLAVAILTYSADKIADEGRLRGHFEHAGRMWVCTGTGPHYADGKYKEQPDGYQAQCQQLMPADMSEVGDLITYQSKKWRVLPRSIALLVIVGTHRPQPAAQQSFL